MEQHLMVSWMPRSFYFKREWIKEYCNILKTKSEPALGNEKHFIEERYKCYMFALLPRAKDGGPR